MFVNRIVGVCHKVQNKDPTTVQYHTVTTQRLTHLEVIGLLLSDCRSSSCSSRSLLRRIDHTDSQSERTLSAGLQQLGKLGISIQDTCVGTSIGQQDGSNKICIRDPQAISEYIPPWQGSMIVFDELIKNTILKSYVVTMQWRAILLNDLFIFGVVPSLIILRSAEYDDDHTDALLKKRL